MAGLTLIRRVEGIYHSLNFEQGKYNLPPPEVTKFFKINLFSLKRLSTYYTVSNKEISWEKQHLLQFL
jgi:hypothetical protein